MKHLVLGDVHGHFKLLRDLLLEQGAINEDNERINRDTLEVYCTGDLVDAGVNRMGDFLILDYVEEWFDAVVIGNHEWPFFGGTPFLGLRMHDRSLAQRLLELEDRGIYVPAIAVADHLLVHGGLANRWGFKTADEAAEAIYIAWDMIEDGTQEMPILDNIGRARSGMGEAEGGIFWCDWNEPRNINFNQVVGHTAILDGPVVQRYKNGKIEHWNIDAGGKFGMGLGGIIIEPGQPTVPVFSGERYSLKKEKESFFRRYRNDDMEWEYIPATDWDNAEEIDDEDNLAKFKELMET